MYKGKVEFTAKLTDDTISFGPVRYAPATPGVDSIELAAPLGHKLIATVEVSAVSTPDIGRALARSATEAALNRLAYFYQVAIDRARITSSDFASMQPGSAVLVPTPAYLAIQGQQVRLVRGIGENELRGALEPPTQPGEQNFVHLRSARLSISPVEEFMHLYAILMQILGDSQAAVDAFIVNVEPAVPRTQSLRPRAKAGEMETVYTRLRNELAHNRAGVQIDTAKQEMASKVGDLRGIVKEAIRLNP